LWITVPFYFSFISCTEKSSLLAAAAAQQPWVGLGFFHSFPPFSMVFGSPSPVPNTIIC
jgi:hypothetical protein